MTMIVGPDFRKSFKNYFQGIPALFYIHYVLASLCAGYS